MMPFQECCTLKLLSSLITQEKCSNSPRKFAGMCTSVAGSHNVVSMPLRIPKYLLKTNYPKFDKFCINKPILCLHYLNTPTHLIVILHTNY